MTVSIDMNELTLGDLADVSRQSGLTLTELETGMFSFDALIALAWVSERRTNPEFTMDDARNLRPADIQLSYDQDPQPANT